jgi:hypothetical protein
MRNTMGVAVAPNCPFDSYFDFCNRVGEGLSAIWRFSSPVGISRGGESLTWEVVKYS